jgi:uncharacterized membrane protein
MRMTYASSRNRHRIGIVALAVVVAAFLAYSLPPYFSGDPTRSRVPATFGLHYPLLVAHVMLATVAMTTALPQIWPWLRRRHRALHRRIGTVYVWTAVAAGVCGLVIGAATPFGPILLLSNLTMAPLWLCFTIAGYRAGRQRRFADHRRHMIRSVTLTFSIISNRIWTAIFALSLEPLRESVFHGSDVAFLWVAAGLSGWLGWTIPLAIAQWLLNRTQVMPRSSILQAGDIQPV